ncbi:uncharacterized protein LAESUDRAFT_709889 [Laetiporus sulphureus 93-53]|uniref:LIM-domain binding protein-domain-containing protein n=1 Tax=Laetiporus sulphureus 93-53 TaxID=1314785 RepID=A0A165I769_9APHY|nr:uncharacterized protein LAESUDRAFT_709889 [Laetiporus sulphureus 93-53]KZT12683.1 hypothetical protein LAESUDRAFT_709889 [Laetiporus sulphureus 93-53]
MNAPPDMLRQGVPHLPNGIQNGMLNMNPQYLPQQPPHGQPAQNQPPQMTLLQNSPTPNPSMGMLGGGQSGFPGGLHQLQLAQSNNYNRQQVLMQQNGSGLTMPPRNPGPPHVNGIAHNQPQGMGFPNGVMQQQGIRRVASHPASLNQTAGQMGGMPQGMPNLGAMGMNPAQNMPAHMRPMPQQQHPMNSMRLQQQPQQHSMQSQMSPDMSMLNRQAHLPMNGGLQPPPINRTASAQAQLMNNLAQPPNLNPSHPNGMQPPMHQNAFQNPMPLPHHPQPPQMGSSSHVGSHSQTHTPSLPPNMSMGNVPHPQAPPNRTQRTPDGAVFMNFPNGPMQPNLPQVPRLPPHTPQFSFATPSTSPVQTGDVPQNVGGAHMNRHLVTTPAQVVEMTQGHENLSTSFSMHPSQPGMPPRPPSQHASHPNFQMQPQQQGLQHHQSPRVNAQMVQMQRPQSQQGQRRQATPQAGPSRTPRVATQALPNITTPRMHMAAPGQPGSQQHPSGQSPPQAQPPHPVPNVQQRQLPVPPVMATMANGPPPAMNQPDGVPPPPPPMQAQPALSMRQGPAASMAFHAEGRATQRLLQFSAKLAQTDMKERTHTFWTNLVKDFFTPTAMMKFTLWKDGLRQEAKPFEIGTPILPRFFLVTTHSGVKSMSLVLDNAREMAQYSNVIQYTVELTDAYWIFRYVNGYTVIMRGPLTAHLTSNPVNPNQPITMSSGPVPKIDSLSFDALSFEKLINVDTLLEPRVDASPGVTSINLGGTLSGRHDDVDRRYDERGGRAILPAEPINAFGIPQATMRCLELAESVTQMSDLIQFCFTSKLGPRDGLTQWAKVARTQMIAEGRSSHPNGGNASGGGGLGGGGAGNAGGGSMFDAVNGAGPVPPYPNAPSGSTQPPGPPPFPQLPGPPPSTPQNAPSQAVDSSAKQNKAPAPSSQASGSTPSASASTPAAAPTPGGPNTTPSMAHASVKRKGPPRTEPESPALANSTTDQAQSLKRPTRKRTRTQGG